MCRSPSSTSAVSSTPPSRTGTARTSAGRSCTRTRTRSGLPNQGVMILYEVLNEREGVLAERTYSVWPDMEALMREHQVPAVHGGLAPPAEGVRRLRAQLLHRARLHQHAHRARPGGHPAGGQGPHDRRPDRPRGRPRGLQPRADRGLHRLRRHRRRRAGRARHDRDRPRLEGRGPPRRARGGPVPPREDRFGVRPRLLRRGVPGRRPHRPCRTEQVGRARGGCPSTPSWTSTSGPTPSSPWSRSPRPSTSGCPWRSSAAAPAAAVSARPA